MPMILNTPRVCSGSPARTGCFGRRTHPATIRLVTAGAIFDDDFFSSDFFSSSRVLENDMWDSMSRQMQVMEKEVTDMLSSSHLAQEAERARLLQDVKPNAAGNGFSYYSEQHGSHFHSWSSVTVWSSTQEIAPTVTPTPVNSGPSGWMVAVMVVLGLYLTIGAAFWARYSETRFSVFKRWQLVALWPFLLAMNTKFRAEFWGAFSSLLGASPAKAEKPKLQDKGDSRT